MFVLIRIFSCALQPLLTGCYIKLYPATMIPQRTIHSMRSSLRTIVRTHGFMSSVCSFSGLPHSATHGLIELDQRNFRSKELAIMLQLDKSSVSRMVSTLLKSGHIKEIKGENKKDKVLGITEKGRKLVQAIHGKVNALMEASLNLLTPEEQHTFAVSTEKYAKAMRKVVMREKATIRLATKKDDADTAEIVVSAIAEHGELRPGTAAFDPDINMLSKALSGPRAKFFVVELEGEVVGCGGVGPTPGLDKYTCELKRMFFRPEVRSLGLGKMLMDTCLNAARNLGYKKCYLETLEGFAHARKFYEQEGFKKLSKPLGNSGHTACEYWMLKEL